MTDWEVPDDLDSRRKMAQIRKAIEIVQQADYGDIQVLLADGRVIDVPADRGPMPPNATQLPESLNINGDKFSLTVMEVLTFDTKGRPCDVRIIFPDDPRSAKDLGQYIKIYASHKIRAYKKRKRKRSLRKRK